VIVAVLAIGSRGDVQPYVALAERSAQCAVGGGSDAASFAAFARIARTGAKAFAGVVLATVESSAQMSSSEGSAPWPSGPPPPGAPASRSYGP